MHAQIEYGLCPATMTQASIPLLQKEPALWEALREKLFSDRYDPSDVPVAKKSSIWLGMGMTEKQGGSDVRANTTVAVPVIKGGRGGEYKLRGHKWFSRHRAMPISSSREPWIPIRTLASTFLASRRADAGNHRTRLI
jgi:putative acyl-CoA dehydrogenase